MKFSIDEEFYFDGDLSPQSIRFLGFFVLNGDLCKVSSETWTEKWFEFFLKIMERIYVSDDDVIDCKSDKIEWWIDEQRKPYLLETHYMECLVRVLVNSLERNTNLSNVVTMIITLTKLCRWLYIHSES